MTIQRRDIIHYKDDSSFLCINILSPYFEEFPERLVHCRGATTSLWRGYFAEYTITKGSLYITSLKRYVGFDREKRDFIEESTLDISFPDTKKCSFFSGWIEINIYPETFEDGKIKLLEIQKGDVVQEMLLTEAEFKTLKETETYKEFDSKHSFMWY
ncbi:hypothetical protein U8527_13430 [Kordia algicida OT-1]|uniref:Uncharacterized protein n=1 Tax=Kordia algicida OT-1 TaxID=391587 RepID=A9E5S5_9FLAO|nr:hypothetical protein [Kordia algicida]EDP95215.1 hypothetical protein KAOT1_07017 [Kordia algicida OT-1]